ncbi:MAG: DUF420 domain-containing protein [Rhodospirillales bacterium]
MEISDYPHMMAVLNGMTIFFLTVGFLFIRRGQIGGHRASMCCALAVSAVFIVVYIIYKSNSGFAKFGGEGLVRPFYFSLLVYHIIGAAALAVLAPILVWRAFKADFARHKKLARWVWPMWMFVGISGLAVYYLNIHVYPQAG